MGMEDMLENREMLKACDGSSEYGHSLAKGMENRKLMKGCGEKHNNGQCQR